MDIDVKPSVTMRYMLSTPLSRKVEMFHNPKQNGKREQGSSLLEFAIAATVFLTVLFAVVEFGRALWVHNALSDAARRGARYAVLHKATTSRTSKRLWSMGI